MSQLVIDRQSKFFLQKLTEVDEVVNTELNSALLRDIDFVQYFNSNKEVFWFNLFEHYTLSRNSQRFKSLSSKLKAAISLLDDELKSGISFSNYDFDTTHLHFLKSSLLNLEDYYATKGYKEFDILLNELEDKLSLFAKSSTHIGIKFIFLLKEKKQNGFIDFAKTFIKKELKKLTLLKTTFFLSYRKSIYRFLHRCNDDESGNVFSFFVLTHHFSKKEKKYFHGYKNNLFYS